MPTTKTATKSTWREKVIKYKVPIFGVIALFLLFIIFSGNRSVRYAIEDMMDAGSTGLYGDMYYDEVSVPAIPSAGRGGSFAQSESAMMVANDGMYDTMPVPDTSGYVANLEAYETTDYRANARTKDFDEACALLEELKARDSVDFRVLNSAINRCSATFYADPSEVPEVLMRLEEIDGVEISSDTTSVTRQRQNLLTESGVLAQQLVRVEETLQMAELQYTELTEIAREAGDASSLTEAIRDKLTMIETLDQKRINLLVRIRRIDQQSADLEERIGVVAFNVSFTRAYPVDTDGNSRKWENAWESLKDQTTYFFIGMTFTLVIFMMKVVQFALYAFLLLFIARFGWKLVRRVWQL